MAPHELNYYSRNPPNPWKWLGWIDLLYKRNFQTCLEKRKPSSTSPSSTLIGEKSASYLYHRDTPLRISQHLSNDPKFIVLLRNPISRLHSHWFMNICKGRIESSFKQWFWKDEINKKVGFYAQQLKKWLEVYPNPNSTYLPSSSLPRSVPLNSSSPVGDKPGFLIHPQFLILRSEDFFTKTVESLKRIDEFLGVQKLDKDWNWEKNRQLVEGVVYGSSPRCVEKMGQNRQEIEPEFRRQLEKFYHQANQELTELLGAEFNFNLENREYSPEIENQDRNENGFLDDYYNDDDDMEIHEEDDDEG
jgi:hypothetical protein